MDSQDYKNWIISLNSDNFSTYIKVWFAYLASIHELILSSLKEEDKDALVSNRKGDSIYLNIYKKDIAPKIIIEETTRNAIIRCYKKSKQIIKENFPEFFHVTYYKKIQPIDVFTKEPINISNDFYKFDVKIKNNDLEIGLLLVKNNKGQIPLQKKLNKIYYSAVVPLDVKGKNLWMINDNNKFRRFVFDNCMSQFEKNIVAKTNTKLHKEILGKFRDVFIIIVYNKCANLQQKIYKENITDNSTDKEVKEWFLDFSYSLRNVLFHKIINPFDDSWSQIFKDASQALYSIVMYNISLIIKFSSK